MITLNKDKLEQMYAKRKEKIIQLVQNMQYTQQLNANKVFEPYNPKNRELVYEIAEDYILPESTIVNAEQLEVLLKLAKEGKSCIIMSEHYSNFDSIGLYYIIRKKYPHLLSLFENLIFLAASKLNTEHKIVLAFSESMSRLIIHQARNQQQKNITKEDASLLASVAKSSFQKMQELKNQGNIIFMFPSGTRFRENQQNSRQAIEQTASFLKRFDYVCFLGIKGNVLTVSSTNMSVDELQIDTLVYYFSAPQKCSDVLENAKKHPINTDKSTTNNNKQNDTTILKKQVSSFVTTYLLQLHEKATLKYKEIMGDNIPVFIGEVLQ